MTRKTTSKERVYDIEIYPLMVQVVELCKRNGIAAAMFFDISGPEDPGLFCSTLLGDENNNVPASWKHTPICVPNSALGIVEDPTGRGRLTDIELGTK